jgi:hypothetical protein
MSKMSSYEKFFIGRIAWGLESLGYSISQEDIEILLSSRLNPDDEFVKKIKSALSSAYSKDVDSFKRKLVSMDPSELWEESIIKLYKGRETLLRDVAVEWYSKYTRPGFWETIKSLFKGRKN